MIDPTHEIPINKTAALVMSRGFQYSPDKKISCFHSDTCPQLEDIRAPEFANNKSFNDLSGIKLGELKVIGKAAGRKGWVVRCNCGMYEIRRAKAIQNKENWGDRCCLCLHLAYLKRKGDFNAYGENRRDLRSY